MTLLSQARRILVLGVFLTFTGLAAFAVRTFLSFQPAAITLGPNTTIYMSDDPSLATRVHEAIHRRQMRDKSPLGRWASALRYNFDYEYRLDEEAEAKAGEICLQIHKFSRELPAYTTARSRSQAEVYRAWAWERIGPTVADRVGEKLRYGERCHEILAGVTLDVLPGEELSDDDALKLAAFRFLQAYGSSETEVAKWKARLELVGWAEPAPLGLPEDAPPFWLLELGRSLAAPVDTTIDETAAGRALHRLTYYRAERMYTQLLPPLPGYRHRATMQGGDAAQEVSVPLAEWPTRLLGRALRGELTEDQAEWLTGVASHPILADFEVFARAPEADILGTRYRLPEDGRWDRLVLTELGPVRQAFQLQWGRAALAAANGDLDGARTVLQMVISGALQMSRNAPFEVDVVEALVFLELALRSLAELEETREGTRPEWAAKLDEDAPDSWARGHRAALFSEDPAVVYHALPRIAKDPDVPHAFKRFAYRQVVLFDVCLGLREGRAAQSRAWRRGVEQSLVRRESDARVLEMMRDGVHDLMVASDVTPESICAPSVVVQPGARFAIMSSPLRSTLLASALPRAPRGMEE